MATRMRDGTDEAELAYRASQLGVPGVGAPGELWLASGSGFVAPACTCERSQAARWGCRWRERHVCGWLCSRAGAELLAVLPSHPAAAADAVALRVSLSAMQPLMHTTACACSLPAALAAHHATFCLLPSPFGQSAVRPIINKQTLQADALVVQAPVSWAGLIQPWFARFKRRRTI